MGGIGHALRTMRALEDMAGERHWLNRIHPLAKLSLTVIYIAAVASLGRYDLMGLLGMAVYPLLLSGLAEISLWEAMCRMRMALPFVCAVGIFHPFLDKSPVAAIGGLTVTGGMISMAALVLKGILCVLASYLLAATTSMEQICYALRLLRLPKLFVTQVLLSYRYLTLLLKEAERMQQAYLLRAPGQRGIHYRAWGSFLGQLLLRTMDRAEGLYESMCLRGYHGEFYYGRAQRIRAVDVGFFALFFALIVLFRSFPVFVWVGDLIK